MPTGVYKHKSNQGFQEGNILYEHSNSRSVRFKKGRKSKNWNGFKKGQLPTAGSFKKGHTLTQERHERGEFGFLIGNTNTKGKHWKVKDTSNMKGRTREKSSNWLGGISKEPYSFDFTRELKELIRKRDNYTCQICSKKQIEDMIPFPTHHIDYNKKNSNSDNLITLCKSCHSKTNFNRNNWIKYFNNL